jgi:SAM-dependent methyltransferase
MYRPSLLERIIRRLRREFYFLIDRVYLPADRREVLRSRNLTLIPPARNRRGGKQSYAEWGHVIGVFQTLLELHLGAGEGRRILDVGCGTGLMAIAASPFVGGGGRYTGIDVMRADVEFCRRHYPADTHEFVHFDVSNPMYAPAQASANQAWPLDADAFDMVTAVSVWTHLNETDAVFYLSEVARVLRPGGKAVITFFILDETYRRSLPRPAGVRGRFHMTRQKSWIFDQPSYGSDAWFHPAWVEVPENAIGVTEAGLERLQKASGLTLLELHTGNWKEQPGVFFQDVLVFRKD